MEQRKLNPSIAVTSYGKRELKDITIYPLSAGDQFKISEIVAKVISDVVEQQSVGTMTNFAYMNLLLAAIQDNISKIIPMISDLKKEEVEGFLDDLTNEQLTDVAVIVWTNSFEPAIKKGKDLFEKARKLFLSERSSQPSFNGTRSTDSTTSSDSHSETED